MRRWTVRWFRAWQPVLDEALEEIETGPRYPPGLYQQLLANGSQGERRIALVLLGDNPVGVAALRPVGPMFYEPITSWIVPGFVVPAAPDLVLPALSALARAVRVAWWRLGPVPPHPHVANRQTFPVYRVALDGREAHWRAVKYWRHVVNARNRCRDLELRVNQPGAGELVVRRWFQRWHPDQPAPTLADHVLAYQHLERTGRLASVLLLEDDRVLGGATAIVDQDCYVAGVMFDAEHSRRAVGVRLIDAMMQVAADQGGRVFDLGGDHEYKARWAPSSGTKSSFTLAPLPFRVAHRVRTRLRTAAIRG